MMNSVGLGGGGVVGLGRMLTSSINNNGDQILQQEEEEVAVAEMGIEPLTSINNNDSSMEIINLHHHQPWSLHQIP